MIVPPHPILRRTIQGQYDLSGTEEPPTILCFSSDFFSPENIFRLSEALCEPIGFAQVNPGLIWVFPDSQKELSSDSVIEIVGISVVVMVVLVEVVVVVEEVVIKFVTGFDVAASVEITDAVFVVSLIQSIIADTLA